MPERSTHGRLLNADVLLAFAVGGVLCIMLLPMPTLALDLLLVFNIASGLFILLMMFYLQSPLDFSSFPALLLILTLFRLSLNVASTKLILLNGQAGNVISAFGEFVVGSNTVVGAVVFLILVLINFLVITKGSGRIAEVAARFTLDAMPGKQMSIDADLNAGIIDEDEARTRRERLSQESDFYGSMDGASKFVKGDAIAGLVITGVNIAGGLAIGVFQGGMKMGEALKTYTILTIGDGLVSQIPALVISIAAGMLVTKAASSDGDGGLGGHISRQLMRRPEPWIVCAVMLLFLALMPQLPFLPFAVLAAAGAGVGMHLRNQAAAVAAAAGAGAEDQGGARSGALPGGKARNALEDGRSGSAPASEPPPRVTPMSVEIGFGLVPLVDQRLNGDLVERIGLIRDQIRDELGFLIPSISVQDNLELGNNEYRILVRGLERARGTVQVGSRLAINPGDVAGPMEGVRTTDPAFGFEAVWINPRRADAAEAKGYTVVDCSSVIATHVTRIIREHAGDLLSRQGVSDLLDELRRTDAAVIQELVPARLQIGVVHRVLQFLLGEQVPIHDLAGILETLSDFADQTKDPMVLCEYCRQTLKGHIVSGHLAVDGTLYAIILHPELEAELQQALGQPGGRGIAALAPERVDALTDRVLAAYENAARQVESDVVLLTGPLIRPHLCRMVERKVPDMPVLSYAEVADDVSMRILGTVSAPSPASQAGVGTAERLRAASAV